LEVAPDHPRTLWIAALSAAEQGDSTQAKTLLERLATKLEPGSEAAAAVQEQLKQLQDTGAAESAEQPDAAPASAPASLQVQVSIDEALRAQAPADATVFVFAKAKGGPPMPLAVIKAQVKDLPLATVLDDSKAMAPGMTLSKFPEVIVGARVSRTGDPMAQSGDLEGTLPVEVAKASRPITIVIDKVVP
jgi:cytochrome c-type biogenesis protein CcmH